MPYNLEETMDDADIQKHFERQNEALRSEKESLRLENERLQMENACLHRENLHMVGTIAQISQCLLDMHNSMSKVSKIFLNLANDIRPDEKTQPQSQPAR